MSLLNVEYKIVLKALSIRLKNVLPSLVSSEQTAYVKDRSIVETVKLASNLIAVTGLMKMEGFLGTMNIEKLFDSVDPSFSKVCSEQV